MINLASRRMVGLNPAGGRIWESLASSPDDFATLVAGLDLGADTQSQVRQFIAELAAEGLVDAPEIDAPAIVALAAVPTGPAITWREDLLRFGGACNKIPGQDPYCDQNPRFS